MKVPLMALRNAISIAGQILTIETLITDIPGTTVDEDWFALDSQSPDKR